MTAHVVRHVIPAPGPWADQAACRTEPTALFFPERGEPVHEVCAGCPVVDACRAYGLAHPTLHGIWGGLTGKQRRRRREARGAA